MSDQSPHVNDLGGAAVRGEAVAEAKNELSYKGDDGKYLDAQGWEIEHEDFGSTVMVPIHRNGVVIALVVSEWTDDFREVIAENCRILCDSARAADAPSEPSRSDVEAIDRAMQHMGDALNALDLADEDDEKITADGFAAIARLLKFRAADALSEPSEFRKTLKSIDSLLRGKVCDPDPLPPMIPGAVSVATTYGLVSGLLREVEQLRKAAKDLATAKNFHRSLCDRFGYSHDDQDWLRDLVSLEEHIATKVKSRAADALDSQPTNPYPLLRAAFTTAESGADGYFVKFKFPTMEAMQAAHMQWHGVDSSASSAPVAPIAPDAAKEVLRLALMEHSIANYQAQMHVGHWSHKARMILAAPQQEGSEAGNG